MTVTDFGSLKIDIRRNPSFILLYLSSVLLPALNVWIIYSLTSNKEAKASKEDGIIALWLKAKKHELRKRASS